MRSRMLASVFPGGHAECCRRQAVPAAKSKGKGRYLPKGRRGGRDDPAHRAAHRLHWCVALQHAGSITYASNLIAQA